MFSIYKEEICAIISASVQQCGSLYKFQKSNLQFTILSNPGTWLKYRICTYYFCVYGFVMLLNFAFSASLSNSRNMFQQVLSVGFILFYFGMFITRLFDSAKSNLVQRITFLNAMTDFEKRHDISGNHHTGH